MYTKICSAEFADHKIQSAFLSKANGSIPKLFAQLIFFSRCIKFTPLIRDKGFSPKIVE